MTDIRNPENGHAHPLLLFPAYASTVRRAPSNAPIRIPQTTAETSDPRDGWDQLIGGAMADMTRQNIGEPLGKRIVVTGRVLDENARPVPNTVIELSQANTSGRQTDARDDWPAPLDPNLTGAG